MRTTSRDVRDELDRQGATLPTMYDLPSEDPEEPGLPDDFHYHQPQLLRETFAPPGMAPGEVFVASDMNLYYDVRHTLWHKRPDWFAVLGVPPLYEGHDLRLSYVFWQERVAPYLVVELLSPGTQDEDLGQSGPRDATQPPTKWEVYERILEVPYYVVYSRYDNRLRAFALAEQRYREQNLTQPRLWLPEIGLGLGVWTGEYAHLRRDWLRFYDAEDRWIPRPAERESQRADEERARAEHERARAEHERARADEASAEAERLRALVRSLGGDPRA